MNFNLFYTLQGKTPVPCDNLMEWELWFVSTDRHVGLTLFGDIRVSTVFLGLDHRHGGEGPPILFETMCFIDGDGKWQDRCCTYEDAEKMHADMCARVKNHLYGAAVATDEIIGKLELKSP